MTGLDMFLLVVGTIGTIVAGVTLIMSTRSTEQRFEKLENEVESLKKAGVQTCAES